MLNNTAKVRELPNHQLYHLRLEMESDQEYLEFPRPVLYASLTEVAEKLGVKFDEARKDHILDLTKILGNDNGEFVEGANFHLVSKNILLDDNNEESRVLRADLRDFVLGYKKGSYKLDKHLGLIAYAHPQTNEIYYKLDRKQQLAEKRTLVLCFDGTSNQFSNQNTNVVKFVDLLMKDNPERQLVYYQPGVGTYVSPGWIGSITKKIATTADEAIAWYLYQHIIDGYKYLVETYRAGDRICIVGFSRGAYTARGLAGMLHCVGLLSRHNIEHIPFAYQIYESHKPNSSSNTTATETPSKPNYSQYGALGTPNGVTPQGGTEAGNVDAEAYKRTFCIPVKIDFVGVWDTVGSVGSLIAKTLPFIDYNPSIRVFRQALALDERRANFVPSLWNHTPPNEDHKGEPDKDGFKPNVREVWFRGQHSDIGGGANPPKEKNDVASYTALSNITLRWMVQQCIEHHATGIIFDYETMKTYRQVKVLEEREPPTEKIKKNQTDEAYRKQQYERSAELDRIDIKHQPCETITWTSGWNFLEFWPSSRPVQTEPGKKTNVPNVYNPRMVYRQHAKCDHIFVHASVIDFLKSADITDKKNVPRATWHGFEPGELPKIDGYMEEAANWPEEAAKAMNMNWKESPGWMSRVTSWVTSWWAKPKERTE